MGARSSVAAVTTAQRQLGPGPCPRFGYDLRATARRSAGVWVCPECRYVSRVDDWDSGSAPESPSSERSLRLQRRAKWRAMATALNVFLLVPVVATAAWMLGSFWWLAVGAGVLIWAAALGGRAALRYLLVTGQLWR